LDAYLQPHDQHRPDHAASFSHKTEKSRDSASLASRIRFPTRTTVDGGLTVIALALKAEPAAII
jgi:hypothetical protein